MGRGIFITGTDTGVGKTVVSAVLLLALREAGIDAGYMKPVATGCITEAGRLVSPDVKFIREVCRLEDDDRLVNPVAFARPVDPLSASLMERKSIEIHGLRKAYDELSKRHGFLIVEGIGGIAVPINRDIDVCGLISVLGLPALVVIRPSLGTINHTIMTLDYAGSRGVDVLGLVVNSAAPCPGGPADRTGPELIKRTLGLPVVACVDHDPDLARDPAGAIRRAGQALAKWAVEEFNGWNTARGPCRIVPR